MAQGRREQSRVGSATRAPPELSSSAARRALLAQAPLDSRWSVARAPLAAPLGLAALLVWRV